jgi:mannose-6-phosphate isomerase
MLYPLKFQPIFKHRIWGGNKLQTELNKNIPIGEQTGESWELSAVPGDESVVINGELAGDTLTDLLEVYMDDLVGEKVFAEHEFDFPLLFKFLEANDNLSIQVHPNDELALERHGCLGKTEIWYVVDAEPDAELIIGFNQDVNRETYLQHLQAGTLETILRKVKVQAGDVFFIPSGLIHALGKGIMVAEVQQSSDITYRLYDYNRTDKDGNPRELHTEQALDAIDFDANTISKVNYPNGKNKLVPITHCEHFNVGKLAFDKSMIKDYSELDSFVVYMCLSGEFEIVYSEGKETVKKGETVMIPAELKELELLPKSELVEVLEVWID